MSTPEETLTSLRLKRVHMPPVKKRTIVLVFACTATAPLAAAEGPWRILGLTAALAAIALVFLKTGIEQGLWGVCDVCGERSRDMADQDPEEALVSLRGEGWQLEPSGFAFPECSMRAEIRNQDHQRAA